MSFTAWGHVVHRRRWPILACSALLLAASVLGLAHGGPLTSGSIDRTESARALALVERVLGHAGGSSFTIVFRSDTLPATSPEFRAALHDALEPLRRDPRVSSVVAPDTAPPGPAESLLALDGHGAVAVVELHDDFRAAMDEFAALRELVPQGPLQPTFTGHLSFMRDLDGTLQADLHRAELVSLPLAVLVLLSVFSTLVAAILPVAVGGFAVLGGVAAVLQLARVVEMAQYTINVVTLIGLGVAIDYSLFIVSRFRDELAGGLEVADALGVAMATAGRAVAFSGLAVGIGLSGLLFFAGSYLKAMGIAGAIVVAMAVIYALTLLPALLSLLGPRVEALRVPIPRFGGGEERWRRLAARVMRHPVAVLVPTLAVVLLAGAPFLRLDLAAADVRSLPSWTEARRGHEMLTRQFPAQAATRMVVAVRFPPNGDAPLLTPARLGALYDLSRRIAAVPGVERVESIVDLDPSLDRSTTVQMLAAPPAAQPPALREALARSVGNDTVVLTALTQSAPDAKRSRDIVRAIRAERRVADGDLSVTGQTANDVDATAFILTRVPVAVAFVMVATAVILFLQLGSLVLPIKAIVMNLLSIAASFGALVWIFQDGHLHALLGFEPGRLEPALPVLLFCAVFGLSMDYEVLLLSTMQEEYLRSGDNVRAVAEGLARSGRLITSAAAIMVAVFAAFAAADVVIIKAMGLGMALAVALDATLVRVLIVPATMRLFGDWNWWAPAPLVRLHAWLGLGEAQG